MHRVARPRLRRPRDHFRSVGDAGRLRPDQRFSLRGAPHLYFPGMRHIAAYPSIKSCLARLRLVVSLTDAMQLLRYLVNVGNVLIRPSRCSYVVRTWSGSGSGIARARRGEAAGDPGRGFMINERCALRVGRLAASSSTDAEVLPRPRRGERWAAAAERRAAGRASCANRRVEGRNGPLRPAIPCLIPAVLNIDGERDRMIWTRSMSPRSTA